MFLLRKRAIVASHCDHQPSVVEYRYIESSHMFAFTAVSFQTEISLEFALPNEEGGSKGVSTWVSVGPTYIFKND
eukprot:3313322-Ditylum_brightwellii.AAC.1